MKVSKMIYFFLLILLSACSVREREKELEARTNELNQKEQELLLKEKTLLLKEEALKKLEGRLDSSSHHHANSDTSGIYNPSIIGTWVVNMQCTETDCEGSAVGDTKSEQWLISYVDSSSVIAKAMAGNKLVRVYSGKYIGDVLQLTTEQEDVTVGQTIRIFVRLQPVNEKQMDGKREIFRGNECRILYSLSLKRAQQS
jgi:hypothetical protein